jgi:hypothetical protein
VHTGEDSRGWNLGSGSVTGASQVVNWRGEDSMSSQVSFVSQTPGANGAQHYSVWIPVRADVTLDANALSLRVDGSGGEMTGDVGGVLSLNDTSSAGLALRAEFLAWWDQSFGTQGASVADVQSYFNQFAARLTDAPQAQFVKVDVNWDGYGTMSWSVDGLDAANVLAPQDGGPFSTLQLLQDVTVDAGHTSVDANIQLGSQAQVDENNVSISAIDALEPGSMQPTFEVMDDNIDANGVRTVHMTVTRDAHLDADVVSYNANFPAELTSARLLPGSDPLSGTVQFAEDQTTVELTFVFNAKILPPAPKAAPYHVHVIVDHNPNTDAGLVGAWIDTNNDGKLGADEAVSGNLAFDNKGHDFVDLASNRVTVTFNDIMPNVVQQNSKNVGVAKMNVKASNNTVIWNGVTLTLEPR